MRKNRQPVAGGIIFGDGEHDEEHMEEDVVMANPAYTTDNDVSYHGGYNYNGEGWTANFNVNDHGNIVSSDVTVDDAPEETAPEEAPDDVPTFSVNNAGEVIHPDGTLVTPEEAVDAGLIDASEVAQSAAEYLEDVSSTYTGCDDPNVQTEPEPEEEYPEPPVPGTPPAEDEMSVEETAALAAQVLSELKLNNLKKKKKKPSKKKLASKYIEYFGGT